MYLGDDEDTLSLIGPIYDTVIDPSLWPDVLEQLRRHLCFHNASLGVQALPDGKLILNAMAGVSPEYVALAKRYEDSLLDLWGGAARLGRFALEEPVLQSRAAADIAYEDNPYYRHWVRPQGIIDAVAIALARDKTMLGSLAFGHHETAPPVSETQLRRLRLLAPHIRRAVTISRLLEMTTDAATTFEAAVEATQSGILLVDLDLTIIFANQRAHQMLDAGDPVRRVGDRLALRRELARGTLQAAIEAASDNEGRLGRRGIAMPATLADGSAVAMHVMPLARRRLRKTYVGRATAAVFIADAGGPAPLPPDALALLYDLTPAEARVFELVVEGHSTRNAADLLGIAPSTFRTHLLAVFAKTGRHNRVDLTRLAREMSLPN
jgi:DNA-binding CsgD family transcriptional regulator/PAS domain-containing protein